jgi:hypothetical protein
LLNGFGRKNSRQGRQPTADNRPTFASCKDFTPKPSKTTAQITEAIFCLRMPIFIVPLNSLFIGRQRFAWLYAVLPLSRPAVRATAECDQQFYALNESGKAVALSGSGANRTPFFTVVGIAHLMTPQVLAFLLNAATLRPLMGRPPSGVACISLETESVGKGRLPIHADLGTIHQMIGNRKTRAL